VTKGQQAIRELAGAMCDTAGNLPPLSGIFPDYAAPIVRNHPDGRELMMARWGMPSPAFALKGKKSDPGVTNVRNVKSPHWRRWLGVESRVSCLSPASPRMRRCRTAPTLRSGSPFTRRGLSLSSRASGQAGLASDRNKPDGLFVITPKMGLTFVENLPIEKFHGVGPATTTKMNRLGIETGLDLRARCFGMLSTASHFSMRRFGPFPRHSGALLSSTKQCSERLRCGSDFQSPHRSHRSSVRLNLPPRMRKLHSKFRLSQPIVKMIQ
jgi:hypothetical protein